MFFYWWANEEKTLVNVQRLDIGDYPGCCGAGALYKGILYNQRRVDLCADAFGYDSSCIIYSSEEACHKYIAAYVWARRKSAIFIADVTDGQLIGLIKKLAKYDSRLTPEPIYSWRNLNSGNNVGMWVIRCTEKDDALLTVEEM